MATELDNINDSLDKLVLVVQNQKIKIAELTDFKAFLDKANTKLDNIRIDSTTKIKLPPLESLQAQDNINIEQQIKLCTAELDSTKSQSLSQKYNLDLIRVETESKYNELKNSISSTDQEINKVKSEIAAIYSNVIKQVKEQNQNTVKQREHHESQIQAIKVEKQKILDAMRNVESVKKFTDEEKEMYSKRCNKYKEEIDEYE